jgi:hypothetical protein
VCANNVCSVVACFSAVEKSKSRALKFGVSALAMFAAKISPRFSRKASIIGLFPSAALKLIAIIMSPEKYFLVFKFKAHFMPVNLKY